MSSKKEEEKIMKFWRKNKIYEKAKNLKRKAKKFYFLDGPPYATGSIHMGTAMNKILKDFHIRFFRMFGFNVWDKPGYDCHGVPIEHKIEEKLQFKTKKDIEKFGVKNFIKECRKFATKFIKIQSKQFFDLGVWMDWSDPYLTLTNDYIEGAWYTFKKAFENGFLYKGSYPVHVCPKCCTAVAYNEIVYEPISDISIYLKFQLKDRPNEFFIVWTTTPWTLPGNTGIMAKPSGEYVKIKVGEENWIICKDLLDVTMKKLKIENYEILDSMKGSELEGLKYEHPLFDLFPFQRELKNAHRVVLSEQFVNLKEGTGLVHCAPGHGQEDYKVGIENNLPIINPLNLDGTFNENCGRFSGIFAKDADELIIQELKTRNLLIFKENIIHDYPLCWRCSSPLLIMAVPQWFFSVTNIRRKLMEENEKINWVPKWAKQRFQNWLEQLGDWPISRQRYWGIPLPIWVCDKCENVKVIGSRKELPKIPKDFHKPYIDEIFLKCKKCNGTMKRVPDVLDVWFDSGVASWASLNYPKQKNLFKKLWPADFVLEGSDQIRGWWNSLMITSIMTFNKKPFNNVLFHGFVLDAHGIKMSKSKGNVVEPCEVIEKYGRDVLRFYFLSSEPWNDYWFDWKNVEETARKLMIFRNVFNFIHTYVTKKGKMKNLKIEDKWILSKLNSLIKNCTNYCLQFCPHSAANEISNFIINDFSRWYIKLIRDRVWLSYEGKDKMAAFFVLLNVCEKILRLLSPFVPFLAEEIYQKILRKFNYKEISIHLLDWPKAEKKLINEELEENMELAKRICEASFAARNKAKIRLRWPLKDIFVLPRNEKLKNVVKELNEILKKACNVKNVGLIEKEISGNYERIEYEDGVLFLNKELNKELLNEALLKETIRNVQECRKINKLKVHEKINLYFIAEEEVEKLIEENKLKIAQEINAKKVETGKLKGKFKGSFDFEDKKIEFSFEKVKR